MLTDTSGNALTAELLRSNFLLFQHGKLIAASPDINAHNAARRLLCNFDGLCNPTTDKRELP